MKQRKIALVVGILAVAIIAVSISVARTEATTRKPVQGEGTCSAVPTPANRSRAGYGPAAEDSRLLQELVLLGCGCEVCHTPGLAAEAWQLRLHQAERQLIAPRRIRSRRASPRAVDSASSFRESAPYD